MAEQAARTMAVAANRAMRFMGFLRAVAVGFVVRQEKRTAPPAGRRRGYRTGNVPLPFRLSRAG